MPTLRASSHPTSDANEASTTPGPDPQLPMKAPEYFDGKSAANLRNFLYQLRTTFKAQPDRSEMSKIMYAASFFRDRARGWMEPYIDADEPPVWMESFKTFSAKLVDVFGDPDTVRNADYRLRKLRQTDTVADYVGEFRHFAQHLSWGDQAFAGQFFEGLKEPIQDELDKRTYVLELEPLIDLALRCDTLLRNRLDRRGHQSKLQPPAPKKDRSDATPKPQTAPKTATTRPSQSPGDGRVKFQPLTTEQKQYRRDNNLCMYCGDPGHFVDNCPTRPASSTPVRVAEAVFADRLPSGNDSAQEY